MRVFALLVTVLAPAASAQSWVETRVVQPSNGLHLDAFGTAVALDGDTLAVGAHQRFYLKGAGWVFERDQGGAGNWGEVVKLETPGVVSWDTFGFALAIDGDTLVSGAPGTASNSGAAYVYERDQGGVDNWGQVLQLPSPSPGAFYGVSVAIEGDLLVVGSSADSPGGAAWLYGRDVGGAGAWGLVRELRGSNAAFGDEFGKSVGLSGDALAVGAPDHGGAGAVYVFERDEGGPGNWGETALLVAGGLSSGARFGEALDVSGANLVAAARNSATYAFEKGTDGWAEVQQLYEPAGPYGPVGGFGNAIDGDRIVTAGYAAAIYGEAYAFDRLGEAGDEWSLGVPVTGCGHRNDRYGFDAAISGSTIAVGAAQRFDENGWMVGAVHVFERSDNSPAERYCVPGTSAAGCEPVLVACGEASATEPSGFSLQARGVAGQTSGLYFFGANGRQMVSWGNGTSFQCVVPPVKRAGLLQTRGPAGFCLETPTQDLNALWCPGCPKPQHNPGAGATVQAQLWYRDSQNTSNMTTSLSSAIEFVVAP